MEGRRKVGRKKRSTSKPAQAVLRGNTSASCERSARTATPPSHLHPSVHASAAPGNELHVPPSAQTVSPDWNGVVVGRMLIQLSTLEILNAPGAPPSTIHYPWSPLPTDMHSTDTHSRIHVRTTRRRAPRASSARRHLGTLARWHLGSWCKQMTSVCSKNIYTCTRRSRALTAAQDRHSSVVAFGQAAKVPP